MRGFALPHPIAPAVFVNSKDVKPARIFTLVHEFVHLLLGSEGISNLNISERSRSAEQRLEVFCNAVAGETLVPRSDLTRSLRTMAQADDLDSTIRTLADSYSVSREVIARRLADINYITRECYREKREKYQSEFEERPRGRQGEFKIPRATMVVRDNGRAFTRLVLTSYNEGFIFGRDVSNLLNAKLKHLDRIRDAVYPVRLQGGATQ
jgi:Zn-dependent peptidase ImmA (M78 family)